MYFADQNEKGSSSMQNYFLFDNILGDMPYLSVLSLEEVYFSFPNMSSEKGV